MTKAELNNPDFPSIIADPVWDNQVQYFFDAGDRQCMNWALDLADYTQVKDLSAKIYYYVYYQIMPKDKTKWNQNKVFSFRNWLTHGCPKDQNELDDFKGQQADIANHTSMRQRKNINDLNADEVEKLKAAFQGIMALDNDDPRSYYQLGGIHWYPGNTYCEHHIQPFLSWHRAYIIQFENALRSIPGCEDVTVPYWDISDDQYPAIFSEAPFNTYTVPQEFLDQYPQEAGPGKPFTSDGTIKRNDEATYNTKKWNHFRDATHDPTNTNKIYLDKLVHFPSWNTFNGLDTSGNYLGTLESLMSAHDTVHVINGPTTQSQDVTGFEPVFWFFHSNWDRMMWQWQKLQGATTVESFKQNVAAAGDDTEWIDGVGLNNMDPFTETLGLTLDQTIDLNALGINYVEEDLPLTKPETFAPAEMSLHRSHRKGQSKKSTLKLRNHAHVSLRVKDVDRLKISGAFTVSLYIGGKLLQTRHFFQASDPGSCANCVKQALVSFDFEFEQALLQEANGELNVEIRQAGDDEKEKNPIYKKLINKRPFIKFKSKIMKGLFFL